MNNELTSLYRLKARLAQDFERAREVLPQKKALDHVVALIAILECLYPQSVPDSDKVIRLLHNKPRRLVSDNEKGVILDWLQQYFRRKNNQPVGIRQLTDLMLADGVHIPGTPRQQVL